MCEQKDDGARRLEDEGGEEGAKRAVGAMAGGGGAGELGAIDASLYTAAGAASVEVSVRNRCLCLKNSVADCVLFGCWLLLYGAVLGLG